jgi:hypothetical protein
MIKYPRTVCYGKRYQTGAFEYRSVKLTKDLYLHGLVKGRLMTGKQWADLGIVMADDWVHYSLWAQKPNILLFRRPVRVDEVEDQRESRGMNKM